MENQDIKNVSHLFQKCPYNCETCIFVKRILIRKLIRLFYFEEFQSIHKMAYIKCEHINSHQVGQNILLRIMMYPKTNIWKPKIQVIAKISKIKTREANPMLFDLFFNEVFFYNGIQQALQWKILPKTYLADLVWMGYSQPLIILEDLTARGYTTFKDKLNEINLKLCLKCLALFHANTMKICLDPMFSFNIKDIKNPFVQQEEIKREVSISVFLNNNIVRSFDDELRNKIHNKLLQWKNVKDNSISIINHGSFIRSKIFIKNIGEKQNVKLIGFEKIKLGPPVIDFGRILLTNLPDENDVSILEQFCTSMLQYYLITLRDNHPMVLHGFLRQDIINNLIFAYIDLTDQEKKEIYNHESLLHAFNNLGCFD